jgi:hypothetical protein
MLRFFTRILIFTLMLTAPLSFTGDKCPDFKPASDLRQCQQGKAAIVIVKKQFVTTVRFTDTPYTIANDSPLTPAFHFTPISTCLNLPLHERAPPRLAVLLS